MADAEVRQGPVDTPTDAARPVRLRHPVDGLFALLALTSVVERLWLIRHSWLYLDDWPLALQSRHVGAFIHPYDGHLSIVLLTIYRFQVEYFGFRTSWPLRLAGTLSLVAVAVAMYLLARRSCGPAVALLVSLPMLWFHHMTLEPAVANMYLSLVGAIGCAYILRRPPTKRADAWLAIALTWSLCCAGSGVAVAAACIVFTACTRGPARRWVAVAGPSMLWVLWWSIFARHALTAHPGPAIHGLGIVRAVGTNVAGSFVQLAWGNRVVGGLLGALAVARAVQLGRRGLEASAHVLAWSAALVTWWFGLVISRGDTAVASLEFRYAFLSAAFILLALLPTEPVRIPAGLATRPVVLVAALSVVAGGWWGIAQPSLHASARILTTDARETQAAVALMERGPRVVPDATVGPLTMFLLPARDVRALVTGRGAPFPSTAAQDAALRRGWRVETLSTRVTDRGCSVSSLRGLAPGEVLVARAGGRGAASVEIARRSMPWQRLIEVAPNRAVTLTVPANWDGWRVRVTSGCARPRR